eukprot:s675_g25.t1
MTTLEAGKQPSYGKRQQLIPDGLCSIREHLEQALRLAHPFNAMESLKKDHQVAIEEQVRSERDMNELRLRVLADWRQLSNCKDVQLRQEGHEQLAGLNAKRLGRKPRTALMEVLGRRHGVEDHMVPHLCLTGMPIVGAALESPFFTEHDIPASITLEELLASSERRRRDALRRVEFMAVQCSTTQAEAIMKKTIKEVAQGTMGGPFSHNELVQRHGKFYNVIPSFGLEQGVNEKNEPKYRRIDDHSAGFTNLAAHRKQKIPMAMVDYLIVMIRGLYARFNSQLNIGTEDMRQAYRQIPLLDSQTSLAITAIWDPATRSAKLYEMYGQPFGAGHSVPNFYRTAEWLCRLIVRAFKVIMDHFFDDFYYVDRPQCDKVGMFCIQQAFQLLGFELDPEKSQPPAAVAHVLGVAFNTSALMQEQTLLVEPKLLRVTNFVSLVDAILHRGELSPSVAASQWATGTSFDLARSSLQKVLIAEKE